MVFADTIQDGSISAAITPLKGRENREFGYEFAECALMFRYAGENSFYAAGIGGFGRKFFIAKVTGSEWQLLVDSGRASDLQKQAVYDVRAEFHGDRLTLLHNGVRHLTAIDGTYSFGACGLRTNRTEAIFSNVDITPVQPRCFVIMPFAPDLQPVYEVIRQTVESRDIKCERADERFVSNPIIEDVRTRIAAAELVIVDFTGRNPNVYFEAGLANAWNKKWIVLAQSPADLAFDVQGFRAITYANRMGADEKLRQDLGRALEETFKASVAVA